MASSTKPVIGMNVDFFPTTKTRRAHVRLNVGYFDSVVKAGGLPIVMPPFAKEAEMTLFLDRVEGLLPRQQGRYGRVSAALRRLRLSPRAGRTHRRTRAPAR